MEILLQYTPIIWGILSIITIAINLKFKDIDSLWFVIGSLVTLVVSLCFPTLQLIFELIIFLILTLIPLITLSKFIKRKNKLKSLKASSDMLVGKKILVTEDCNEFNKGRGKIDNTIWTIICQSGHSLKKGEEAIVVAIDKQKLIVKEIN